jgi:acetolactate synthase small subunit
LKINLDGRPPSELEAKIADFNARILDDNHGHYTIECIGGSQEIDRFIEAIEGTGELTTVVRSGAMAVARGAPVFGRA